MGQVGEARQHVQLYIRMRTSACPMMMHDASQNRSACLDMRQGNATDCRSASLHLASSLTMNEDRDEVPWKVPTTSVCIE